MRIGNVIGDEQGTGRSTFMAQTLDRLVAHKEIVLDISPEVRRDFLCPTTASYVSSRRCAKTRRRDR